ncbi:MAG: hypothetical protein U5K69_00630 [Balneolaceae bacterium]|nr:hypothetical protein [Balneolaceae bacterium]
MSRQKKTWKRCANIFESTNTKLEDFHDQLKRAKHNLSDSKEKYSEIQQTYTTERKTLNELEQKQNNLNQDLSQLQNKRIRIESKLENTEEDLQRIANEINNLEEQISELKDQRETLRGQLEEASAARDQKEKAIDKARSQRQQLNMQRDQLKDQIRSYQSKLDSINSEIELLQDIANSNEAFPSSVQFLLEEHQSDFELLDVVSNVFSTDQQHSVALESVLGEALNFLIVQTINDARRASKMLKEQDKGRATFIPLNQLSGNHTVVDGALYEKVHSESRFESLKKLLLGNVLLFDSVEEAYSSLGGTRNIRGNP